MDTKERLERYHKLSKESKEQAAQFLEENKADRRFASLVDFGNEIISAFEKHLDEKLAEK